MASPSKIARATIRWSEHWNRVGCDCGASNWLYHGREDDVTCYTPEGYRCWGCKKILWVDEFRLEEVEEHGDSISDLDIEDGRKEP